MSNTPWTGVSTTTARHTRLFNCDNAYVGDVLQEQADFILTAVNNHDKLLEALRFYADSDNYTDDGRVVWHKATYRADRNIRDRGFLAQQAIAEADIDEGE